VARLGGDEFAAVLQEITGDDGALKVGAKMVQALCAPFKLTAGEVTIGASIGAAVYPLHATTAEDLVKRADQAMYKAKTSGKNTCISA
jgi:diguanylate cyclase (GGDEF)-like protein